MKIDEVEFFYNINRKIKPGITANRSICFIVENYPEKIQKFALSLLLTDTKDNLIKVPEIIPRCTMCNEQISKYLYRKTKMCKSCCPISPKLDKIPPKEILEKELETMRTFEIAKKYNVKNFTVYKWIDIYQLNK
jgi:hypothetical protein